LTGLIKEEAVHAIRILLTRATDTLSTNRLSLVSEPAVRRNKARNTFLRFGITDRCCFRAMTVDDTIYTLSSLAIAMRFLGTIFVAQTSHAARCGDVTNDVGASKFAMTIHCTSDARVSGGKASRSCATALSVRCAGDASLASDIASRSKRRRTMLVFEASYTSVGSGIASRRTGGTIRIDGTSETHLSANIATVFTMSV